MRPSKTSISIPASLLLGSLGQDLSLSLILTLFFYKIRRLANLILKDLHGSMLYVLLFQLYWGQSNWELGQGVTIKEKLCTMALSQQYLTQENPRFKFRPCFLHIVWLQANLFYFSKLAISLWNIFKVVTYLLDRGGNELWKTWSTSYELLTPNEHIQGAFPVSQAFSFWCNHLPSLRHLLASF